MFEMRQLCYSMIGKVIPDRKASQQSPYRMQRDVNPGSNQSGQTTPGLPEAEDCASRVRDATQSSIFLASGFSAPKHYPRPLHRLSRAPLGGTGKVLDLPFLDGDVAHRDDGKHYYDRRNCG